MKKRSRATRDAGACIAVALLFHTEPRAAASGLATDLRPEMLLVYASDGRDQPPWTVVVAEAGAALKDNADCARLRIRRQPAQAQVDEERLCVESGTLYAWNEGRSAWLPQRPVEPHRELTLQRANGDTVRYVTGDVTEEVIGTLRLRVLETTVTTTNAEGRAIRRLRERYAVSLATATGGRFEVPDPTNPNVWQTQQAFELSEIRMPR